MKITANCMVCHKKFISKTQVAGWHATCSEECDKKLNELTANAKTYKVITVKKLSIRRDLE